MKKILIVYGSVGLGHKVVAENIGQALKKLPGIEILMLDVLEMYRGLLTKTSAVIYRWIIKYFPWLWGFFYTNQFFQKFTLPLRLPFAAGKLAKFKQFVARERPDLILTTHPTATALAASLKKSGIFTGPLVTTFSDFHFQPYWVYPRVDRYLVMTEEQRAEVIKRGFAPQRVVVTGVPVDEVYSQAYESAEVLREFGLSRSKSIILVMGGSRSWGVRREDIEALLGSLLDVQVVVLVGLNPDLYEKLQKLAQKHPGNLKVLGNLTSKEVAKLFSVAKILVTKPGGLTVGQALIKGLPMVLVNPLPTMEELNQEYLVKSEVAVAAKNSQELRSWAERLLLDQRFYKQLKDNLKKLRHPEACKLAARAIIDML